MESAARVALLLLIAVIVLQIAGVNGEGVASSPGEAAGRVTRWLRAKFIGA